MTTNQNIQGQINAAIVNNHLKNGSPRSTAFKNGMLSVINKKSGLTPEEFNYEPGTAEADSFEYGELQGRELWGQLLFEQLQHQQCEACE